MKHLPTMLPLLMTNSTAMAAGQNMPPPIIPAGSADPTVLETATFWAALFAVLVIIVLIVRLVPFLVDKALDYISTKFGLKPRNQAEKCEEIARLNFALQIRKNLPNPPHRILTNSRDPVWEIELAGDKTAYMRFNDREFDNQYIVYIDAEKFYYHWLRSTDGFHKCPTRAKMPLDRKYAGAETGFSHGRENPVPLAYPHITFTGNEFSISFTNGITRTIWLIANGAKSFPIEVREFSQAELFHGLMGVGHAPITGAELKM
ncbi:plasmid fertility inhibition factor family protein [Thalassospira marina]|nr:hypothetical protein [Thalassospira marina]|tara:strand:+ start:1541 stop:2323 length:783 start_codon:yes stop_codon:yes gene_type:complete